MIGHLVYNFEHLDDARLQQRLSKKLYAKKFGGVYLVHAYNGLSGFGYRPYLEDKLIYLKNRGHYQGAADLINVGLNFITKNNIPELKYVLVTAADTLVFNVKFLTRLFAEMKAKGQVLATSSWGLAKHPQKMAGFATDFFVIDIEWNRKAKLFPVDYQGFRKKFEDLFAVQYTYPILEMCVQYNFQKYFIKHYQDNEVWRKRNQALRRIVEREPVHNSSGERRNNWPKLGLYTAPNDKQKIKLIEKLKI